MLISEKDIKKIYTEVKDNKSIHSNLIKNCKNVATSFPNFIELANKSGLTISEVLR